MGLELAVGIDAHHPHGGLAGGVGAGNESQVVSAGVKSIDLLGPAVGLGNRIGDAVGIPGSHGRIHGKVSGPDSGEDLGDVVELAAGENHFVAMMDDGSVYAWGLNSKGQLGTEYTTTPVTSNGSTMVRIFFRYRSSSLSLGCPPTSTF